jgi:hypothetical protein
MGIALRCGGDIKVSKMRPFGVFLGEGGWPERVAGQSLSARSRVFSASECLGDREAILTLQIPAASQTSS